MNTDKSKEQTPTSSPQFFVYPNAYDAKPTVKKDEDLLWYNIIQKETEENARAENACRL